MDQQLQELKTKLAQLKGEQVQQPVETVSQEDKEETDRAMIRRIFADMLGWDGVDERKRREREDTGMHVCSSCFLLQPKTTSVCELCTSSSWLVPSQAKSDPEQVMFINMAASYTVAQLKTALYSGWAKTSQRERIVRLLLTCHEGKLKSQDIVEATTEPAPADPPNIDFAGLLAHYDRKLAEIGRGQTA